MKDTIKQNFLTLVVSGYVCALITFVAMLQESDLTNWGKIGVTGIGMIVMLMATIFKNIISGNKFDWCNVVASVVGCATVTMAVALGVWFHMLSI